MISCCQGVLQEKKNRAHSFNVSWSEEDVSGTNMLAVASGTSSQVRLTALVPNTANAFYAPSTFS